MVVMFSKKHAPIIMICQVSHGSFVFKKTCTNYYIWQSPLLHQLSILMSRFSWWLCFRKSSLTCGYEKLLVSIEWMHFHLIRVCMYVCVLTLALAIKVITYRYYVYK